MSDCANCQIAPNPTPASGIHSVLDHESRWRRLLGLLLAGLLTVLFLYVTQRSWVPVHGGVDQNGYLVGGKLLAQTGSMAYRPLRVDTMAIDPMQFVGRMWVGFDLGTPNERYLPKYPVGLPLIYAGALRLAGPVQGLTLVYLISPIAMTLSLIAIFLLARLMLGSIPALGVTLLSATSPATLSLVNNPNSHAVSLMLVTWGMYLTYRWWLKGGYAMAMLAGCLVGAAVSVRYSEGLLVLPLALAALMRLCDGGWRNRKRWLQSALLLAGWAMPVALLLWHNRVAMGAWTGYDPTHESTGFAWRFFVENWDTMLRQMYQTGLMLLFPLALAGLAASFVWNWRVGAFLCLWAVPSLLLYTAYYWAPDAVNNIGYTRFFLTAIPAMAICAFGLLLWPVMALRCEIHPIAVRRLHWGGTIALTLVTLISVPLGIANIREALSADRITRENLNFRAHHILATIPAGNVLISEDINLLHHLQLAGDYTLYSPETFNRLLIDRMGDRNPDEVSPADPGRSQYLKQLLRDQTQTQLDQRRDDLVAGALQSHKRVFLITVDRGPIWSWRRMGNGRLTMNLLYSESDPIAIPRNNRAMRFGMPALQRAKLPTTMPRASWNVYEIVQKPLPAPRPAAKPTTRPAVRPDIRPTTSQSTTQPAPTTQPTK